MSVAAIVPAYNEEQTVGVVLETLLNCPSVDEVILVNDGSTDGTAQVGSNYPVTVVNLEVNLGKGGAMKAGADQTGCDVLVFIDADLVGLRTEHVEALLQPVLSGLTEMSIGVFSDGRPSTDLAQKLAPSLSGQRAVTKALFNQVPHLEESRYGVEVALTRYAERHGVEIAKVPLPALSQIVKEEKLGFAKGLKARMEMYKDIIKSLADVDGE